MENYFTREERASNNQLVVDEFGKSYLLDTARWGRFIGIVYSIAILLVCICFPFLIIHSPQYEAVANGSMATSLATFYVLVMGGINFYPLYALIKSASQARKAISLNNQSLLNDSLRLTRNLYKYLGIITIILICFYGLITVFVLTTAITASVV